MFAVFVGFWANDYRMFPVFWGVTANDYRMFLAFGAIRANDYRIIAQKCPNISALRAPKCLHFFQQRMTDECSRYSGNSGRMTTECSRHSLK